MSSLVFTGFVHADPHAGNLILTDDGRLAFLDFGLMGALPLLSSPNCGVFCNVFKLLKLLGFLK